MPTIAGPEIEMLNDIIFVSMKSPLKTPPKKGQTRPSTIAGGFKDVFENCKRKILGHTDPNLGLERMFFQIDVAIYPRC